MACGTHDWVLPRYWRYMMKMVRGDGRALWYSIRLVRTTTQMYGLPILRPKLFFIAQKAWNYTTLMIVTDQHTSCDWIGFRAIICRIRFTDYGSGMVSWEQQDNAEVETHLIAYQICISTYKQSPVFIVVANCWLHIETSWYHLGDHPSICLSHTLAKILSTQKIIVVPRFCWLIITQAQSHIWENSFVIRTCICEIFFINI